MTMRKATEIIQYLREGSEEGRPTNGEQEAADLIESMIRALDLCFEDLHSAYSRGYRDGQTDLVKLAATVSEASHKDRIDREMHRYRRRGFY